MKVQGTGNREQGGRLRLPEAADAKGIEDAVPTEDGNVFGERLGGEDTVEGIAMVTGETTSAECARCVDGEHGVARIVHYIKKISLENLGTLEFADTNFGGDLPRGCGGDQDVICLIGNEGGGAAAQRSRGEDGPKKCVGIE